MAENIDIYNNPDVLYDSYLEPEFDPFAQQVLASTAITSINGITGPTVTFTGGVSGFSFVPSGTSITLLSPLTTKGDLYTWSTVGIRLPVGANGEVLSADSTQTTGLKWITNAVGTVTSVSVVSANGFAGTVATATTTPAITLSTTITGVLKGDGTAISAAASADIISTLGYTPTNAAIVPSTTPTAGQILVGNAGGTAYAPVSVSGDATLASTGALTLASVIVAGGPTGSATVTPIITYDAKGRLTTVTSATITPAVGSITGLGTGVATALGVNVGTAGAFVVNGGALGTPSTGTVTNLTGTASININGTVGATTPTTGSFTTVTASGLVTVSNGTAAAPSIGFASETNNGIYRPGANNFGIAISGAVKAQWDLNHFFTNDLVFDIANADLKLSRVDTNTLQLTNLAASGLRTLKVLNINVGNVAALVTSSVAMNNGAGAGLGTLTNAPAAGNPTKWIPVDDNGTTRYIPAW